MKSDQIDAGSGKPAERSAAAGAVAVAAFLLWGFLPIYYKLIGPEVSAGEATMHRILWSVVVLILFVMVMGQWRAVVSLRQRPQVLLALCASGAVLALNWGVAIWAITHGQILQTSLGFYISPLLSVLLGFLVLGERLRRIQGVAVGLAVVGVLIALLRYGYFPWAALVIAGSFGLYGLIRKQVAIESGPGLLVETSLILPLAVFWLGWLHVRGEAGFLSLSLEIDLLLIGSGALGVIPLVMFGFAARRLRLSTLGFLQYISPSCHFLTGVFLYGESFAGGNAVAFICIWAGLLLYSVDTLRQQSNDRAERRAAASIDYINKKMN